MAISDEFASSMMLVLSKIIAIFIPKHHCSLKHFLEVFFYFDYHVQLNPTIILLKAAPYDDINFRFLLCNKVVYPTDHDFIFNGIFRLKKIKNYPLFYESDCNSNKLCVYLNSC